MAKHNGAPARHEGMESNTGGTTAMESAGMAAMKAWEAEQVFGQAQRALEYNRGLLESGVNGSGNKLSAEESRDIAGSNLGLEGEIAAARREVVTNRALAARQ